MFIEINAISNELQLYLKLILLKYLLRLTLSEMGSHDVSHYQNKVTNGFPQSLDKAPSKLFFMGFEILGSVICSH